MAVMAAVREGLEGKTPGYSGHYGFYSCGPESVRLGAGRGRDVTCRARAWGKHGDAASENMLLRRQHEQHLIIRGVRKRRG